MERTAAPRTFREHSTAWDPEINVIDYDAPYSRAAAAIIQDNCPGGIWDGNEVQLWFNLRYYRDGDAYYWMLVAAHEFGHAYGLAHVSNCALMEASISYCTNNYPTSGDINGVIALY